MTKSGQIDNKRVDIFLKRLADILLDFNKKEEAIKKQSKQLLEQAIDEAEEKKQTEIKKFINNLQS
jgi:hypothetical protein